MYKIKIHLIVFSILSPMFLPATCASEASFTETSSNDLQWKSRVSKVPGTDTAIRKFSSMKFLLKLITNY